MEMSACAAAATADVLVSVEKTTTVYPSIPTERRSMFLSCCDLVCRTYPYVNRIFFYEWTGDIVEYDAVVASLREGLARTLVHFFFLAGRLSCDHQIEEEEEEAVQAKAVYSTGRLHVDCNDAGVEFVEATAHYVRFFDLQHDGFQYRPKLFWKLTPKSDLLRSDYAHEPILSIQVTRFVEGGGLALGVSLSHALVDAQSFYDFVRCWAEQCRGVPMTAPPCHMRMDLSVASLSATNHQYCLDLDDKKMKGEKSEHVAALLDKQYEEEDYRRPRTDLIQKVFSFSPEALQRLKKKANQTGLEGDQVAAYTTFESFCAHWWQALVKAKDMPKEQSIFLLIPINCRQRFLGLPKNYFGNCLDGALVESTPGELCNSSLTFIASKIHESIKAVTEDTFVKYVQEAEGLKKGIPHFDRRELFHVADSPKFAIYKIDFGWGRPCAVRAEGFRFGAEVLVIAGKDEGSIDLFCALDAHSMGRLENDVSFLTC